MSGILVVLSTFLHALATIVMVGYFAFAGLIYLPILERQMQPGALRDLLEQCSKRLRPYFGGSLLIFIVTGTYLMLVNENYLGLGNFFANWWSILIVVKHVLVLAFLGLAIFSERVFLPQVGDETPEALERFRWALNVNVLLGVLIILSTSMAQAG